MENYSPKNQFKFGFWEGLGLYLGGVGSLVGRIWRLMGLVGLFWEVFFSCLYLEWSSKVLLEASGLDFASILRGLGRILGVFWLGFGRKFREFWLVLGYCGLHWVIGTFWDDLGRQKQAKAGKIGQKPAKANNSKQKRAKASKSRRKPEKQIKASNS